jgi:hypothetical protein
MHAWQTVAKWADWPRTCYRGMLVEEALAYGNISIGKVRGVSACILARLKSHSQGRRPAILCIKGSSSKKQGPMRARYFSNVHTFFGSYKYIAADAHYLLCSSHTHTWLESWREWEREKQRKLHRREKKLSVQCAWSKVLWASGAEPGFACRGC